MPRHKSGIHEKDKMHKKFNIPHYINEDVITRNSHTWIATTPISLGTSRTTSSEAGTHIFKNNFNKKCNRTRKIKYQTSYFNCFQQPELYPIMNLVQQPCAML